MPERITRRLVVWLCLAAASLATPSYAANAPTNLRVASSQSTGTQSIYDLTWEDNSQDEDLFQIRIGTSPGTTALNITSRKNQTLTTALLNAGGNDLDGVTLYFAVRAISSTSGDSAFSNEVSIAAPPVGISITNAEYHQATKDVPITPYDPTVGGAVTGYTVTALPPGLGYSPTTGRITGTPLATGVFRPKITITDGVSTASTFVTMRIIANPGAPVLNAPLPDYQAFANAAPMQIDLRPRFSDPDTTSAVRIVTNRGPIDTILYDYAAPASVPNFLGYANRGDYADVVFHRSVSSTFGAPNYAGLDVVQAGWFKPNGLGNYVSPTLDSQVINEPGISNVRGTIAYAKSSPNDATSQFFFNVSNSLNLDSPSNQGGFAVFGRATTPSLPVIDNIHSLPNADYTITLNGGSRLITDWPTNQVPAGATPAPADLVQILSVTPITTFLTYAVSSNTDPTVASATVTGGHTLEFAPASLAARGESTITVTATDLDGNVTMDSFLVTVKQNYNVWSLSKTFPGNLSAPLDDGERDTMTNGMEYAFDGDVTQSDVDLVSPELSTENVPGGSDHLAITFTHLEFVDDLNYEVLRYTDAGGWITVWQTADGFAHPNVFASVDQGASRRLTVIDPAPLGSSPGAILKVRVTLLPGAP